MDKVQGEVPAGWSAYSEAQAGVDAQWVRRFGDSTLNALVEEGLRNNKSLQAADQRLKSAAQRAKLVGAEGRPQVGIGVNGNRQKSRFLGINIPGGSGGSLYNSYGVSLDAAWELDVWGRIRAAQGAEAAAYEAAEWDQRGAEASLQAQIAKAYFGLVEAQRQITLAQQSYGISVKTLDAIAERYQRAITDEGGTAAQYRISESDAKNAEAEIARWEGVRDNAARQLELLIGRYPSGAVESSKTLPKLPKHPPAGLPSELLTRRPDILAAERSYAESVQRKKEATRALFPSIKLTGSAGTATTELSNILNSSFGIWSLGGSISQSILTGGRLQTERVIRDKEARARLIELQDTVIRACGEVETSLAAERYLRERFQATQEALKLSEEAKDASHYDYRDGVSTIQTVLSAEGRYIQTASALASIQRLLLENRIDLHLALGGDYRPSSK